MHRIISRAAAAVLTIGVATASAATDDREKCREMRGGDDAVAACSRLIGLNPKDAEAYYNRGLVYIDGHGFGNGDDDDRAIADFGEAIKLNPASPKFHSIRGFVLSRKDQYGLAVADYTQAIQLDPEGTGYYAGRANVYSRMGEYDRAIADYDQEIRRNPKAASNYTGRGNAYGHKGEYDRAIADYDQALRLDPSDSDARRQRDRARVAALAARPAPTTPQLAPDPQPALLPPTRVAMPRPWRMHCGRTASRR
jgi:tetratricopeptide (TPR) repeat protein